MYQPGSSSIKQENNISGKVVRIEHYVCMIKNGGGRGIVKNGVVKNYLGIIIIYVFSGQKYWCF